MEVPRSKQEYAQQRSELAAMYKGVHREVTGCDEPSAKANLERRFGEKPTIADLEGGIAEKVIDHDVPWDRMQDIANERRVSAKTMDSLHEAVSESAMEQARDAGYDGLSSGMRRYISDDQFNALYDAYDAQRG